MIGKKVKLKPLNPPKKELMNSVIKLKLKMISESEKMIGKQAKLKPPKLPRKELMNSVIK
jgi:hypothetical protein